MKISEDSIPSLARMRAVADSGIHLKYLSTDLQILALSSSKGTLARKALGTHGEELNCLLQV